MHVEQIRFVFFTFQNLKIDGLPVTYPNQHVTMLVKYFWTTLKSVTLETKY
jgi:hypothetical protein